MTAAERLEQAASGETESSRRQAIQAFLSTLFRPQELEDLVFGLWTEPGRRGHWFSAAEVQRAAGWALAMSRRESVFVRTSLARNPRAGAYDPAIVGEGVTGLWLQVEADSAGVGTAPWPADEAPTAPWLARFRLKPSIAIQSGSQVVLGWLFGSPWMLRSPEERRLAERLQRRFVFTMKAHAAAAGLAGRIGDEEPVGVPLPWTLYHGPAVDPGPGPRGQLVVILDQNETRYAPEDFQPYLAEEVSGADARSAAIIGDEVVRLETAEAADIPGEAGARTCWTVDGLDAVEGLRQGGKRCQAGRDPRRVITNFELVGREDDETGLALCRRALPIDGIVRQILEVTDGWPRRVGRRLFIMSTNGIHWLDDDAALFAWLRSKGAIRWAAGSDDGDLDFVTRGELMACLRMEAPACTAVSLYPWEPAVPEACTAWQPPEGYAPTGAFLDRLLKSFCPATPLDASMLRAMVLTYVWGGMPGQRPVFALTGLGADARGVGRTQCVRLLAELVGGALEVSAAEPGTLRGLEGRLASPSCAHKRVVFVDEFPGVLLPQGLARWIDAQVLEDRSGDDSPFCRPNLVTWCVAARGPEDVSGGCLSDRAVIIRLRAPDRDAHPNWQSDVLTYVRAYRDRILADAVAVLRGQRQRILGRRTRYPAWCEEVLATDPQVNEILPQMSAPPGARGRSRRGRGGRLPRIDACRSS